MKNVFRSALWFLALVGIAVGQTVVSSVPVAPAPPSTKDCPYCLSAIPVKASRCAHCTSELKVA